MYVIGIMERSFKDILADFAQPIPKEYLKTKPVFEKGQKTGEITFAPWGSYVKLLLKYCPGYDWEIRTQYLPDKVIVEGRLTIKAIEGRFVYEATGVQDADNNNYGDAVYDAEASAMRRACAKAGLGLHLWAKQDLPNTNNYSTHQVNKSRPKPTTKGSEKHHKIPDRKVTEAQLKRLYAIAHESGLTNEEAEAVINGFGYQSSKDIPMSEYDEVVEVIKTAKVDNSEPWKNWKSEDDALAYGMNQLPDLHMNRITQEWNNLVPEECKDSKTGKTRYVKGRAWVKRIEELKEIPF